jgi:hypothetical protein
MHVGFRQGMSDLFGRARIELPFIVTGRRGNRSWKDVMSIMYYSCGFANNAYPAASLAKIVRIYGIRN